MLFHAVVFAAANTNCNSFRKSNYEYEHYEHIGRIVKRPPLDVLNLLSYVNIVFLLNAFRKSHKFNAASLFQLSH